MATEDNEKFQALRNMWSSKATSQNNPSRPTSIPTRGIVEQRQEPKKSPKENIPVLKITNQTTTTLIPVLRIEPSLLPNTERSTIFEFVEKLPPIDEQNSLPRFSPSPLIQLQNQLQSYTVLQNAATKLKDQQQKNMFSKKAAIHRWNITRHVFRSGLIFNRTRRASDSIVPLLEKTRHARHSIHTESLDSQTPFENLVDYISSERSNEKRSLTISTHMKRSTSDAIECLQQNKLDDSIFQYEMILRHLKNYEQFLSTHPASSSSQFKAHESSIKNSRNNSLNETELKFLSRSSVPHRQTQSLSRNIGRTFTEFIMNDLFTSTRTSKSPGKERRDLVKTHASAQTDAFQSNSQEENQVIPSVVETTSITTEEAKDVLNELDTILESSNQEPTITPNNEVNVIILNAPPPPPPPVETLSSEQLLMKRLFEGKKTSFTAEDLNMQSLRIPEELMLTYETAKKKCFFDSEEVIYATKMTKISRRGYTEHLRLLCITTERIYNITKKNPYPKEGLLFSDITSISVTPYKDGFMCIHTKDIYEDRGDWLVIVDHPCEFVTKLFTMMKRTNNDGRFLKFETKFKHCRRAYGEGKWTSSNCTIEVRLSDKFRIKKAEYDVLTIYTT